METLDGVAAWRALQQAGQAVLSGHGRLQSSEKERYLDGIGKPQLDGQDVAAPEVEPLVVAGHPVQRVPVVHHEQHWRLSTQTQTELYSLWARLKHYRHQLDI